MIKNLVFSGCGVKIFLYVGILKYLAEHNLLDKVERLVGCSAGSLILFFVALDYSYSEIYELLLGIKLEDITKMDGDSVLNFFGNFGMCSLEEAERILRIILKAKVGSESITFRDLFNKTNKDLIVVATNIHKYKTVFFSKDQTPDMDVVTAVKMSLCIPIFFNPVKYDDEYYVDGGLTCHYPIEYIDPSEYKITLGVLVLPDYCIFEDCLDNSTSTQDVGNIKQCAKIDTIEEYIFSILGCPVFKQIQQSFKNHNNITLLIINNKNPVDFSLSQSEKLTFVDSGYDKITEFYPSYKEYIEIQETKKEYSTKSTQTD